jgi:hypothetical protein
MTYLTFPESVLVEIMLRNGALSCVGPVELLIYTSY